VVLTRVFFSSSGPGGMVYPPSSHLFFHVRLLRGGSFPPSPLQSSPTFRPPSLTHLFVHTVGSPLRLRRRLEPFSFCALEVPVFSHAFRFFFSDSVGFFSKSSSTPRSFLCYSLLSLRPLPFCIPFYEPSGRYMPSVGSGFTARFCPHASLALDSMRWRPPTATLTSDGSH